MYARANPLVQVARGGVAQKGEMAGYHVLVVTHGGARLRLAGRKVMHLRRRLVDEWEKDIERQFRLVEDVARQGIEVIREVASEDSRQMEQPPLVRREETDIPAELVAQAEEGKQILLVQLPEDDDVMFLPLQPTLTTEVAVAWPPLAIKSPLTQLFLKALNAAVDADADKVTRKS